METESADKLVDISVEEFSEWNKRPHKHNFFEIIYIEKGSGMQCINQHQFEYKEGNIFLLPPLDCHSFKIKEVSRFYFIRFTDHYFLKKDNLMRYNEWFDKITYILSNYNKIPGDIISYDNERKFIINNIKTIHQEFLSNDSFSDQIIAGSIASILNILARNIERRYVDKANEKDNRFGEILRFIHTNITDNKKLRIPFLAEKFNVSKTYFSEYFKKQAGKSLADYILKSKLRIAETKILHTDLSLKEIAFQLNFTDSSHLSRSFKKNYGLTIREFKAEGSVCHI